jgi:hypothetical protein
MHAHQKSLGQPMQTPFGFDGVDYATTAKVRNPPIPTVSRDAKFPTVIAQFKRSPSEKLAIEVP